MSGMGNTNVLHDSSGRYLLCCGPSQISFATEIEVSDRFWKRDATQIEILKKNLTIAQCPTKSDRHFVVVETLSAGLGLFWMCLTDESCNTCALAIPRIMSLSPSKTGLFST